MKREKFQIVRNESKTQKRIVYHLSGDFTDSKECYDFLSQVRADLKVGYNLLIIDMEKISFISSSGIGLLAACYSSCTRAEKKIILIAVPESIQTLLATVGLWQLIPHYSSKLEAISALDC